MRTATITAPNGLALALERHRHEVQTQRIVDERHQAALRDGLLAQAQGARRRRRLRARDEHGRAVVPAVMVIDWTAGTALR